MKTTLFVMLALLVSLEAPTFAQNNIGSIVRDVATATIYTGGSVIINDRQMDSSDRQTASNERINNRQMDSWDKRTAADRDIQLAQINAQKETELSRQSAEVNVSNTRTAADVIMSGKSGTVTAQNGQVTAQSDRPLPRQRRGEGGYNGPRQVN